MPTFSFNSANPFVASKLALTISRLNRGWNNTMALKQGDQPLDQFRSTIASTLVTGVQDNFALGSVGGELVWSGTSSVTFTGFDSGQSGRAFFIKHRGTIGTEILFAYNSSSSLDINRIITSSVSGQYLGFNGLAILIHNGTNWYIDVLDPGMPLSVVETAGHFGSNLGAGAPWIKGAGSLNSNTFMQDGNALRLSLATTGYSVTTGTPSYLTFSIGRGLFTVGSRTEQAVWINTGAGPALGLALAAVGESIVRIYRTDLVSAWPIGTADVRMVIDLYVN